MFVRTQDLSKYVNLNNVLEVFTKENLIFAKPAVQGEDDILLASYDTPEQASKELFDLMREQARYDSNEEFKRIYEMPEKSYYHVGG
ncbi:MAG: hypothetical protein J5656_02100 [Clostridia bacterium]|nr:hypothetical protein [Clostridia bacterium]